MNSGPLRAFAFQSDRLNTTGQVNARFIRSRRLTANDVLANNVRANCVVTGGIEAENLRANQITAGEFMAVDFQADTFTGTDLVTEMFESMDIDVEDIPMDEAQDHPHENPLQQQFPQQQPPQQDPPQQPQQHHRRNNRRKSNFNEGDRRQMPLVVFGAGMIGADNMPFAGHMSGVTGKILKQLRVREGRGECCVLMIDLMIDEFKTSKVCRRCLHDDLVHPHDADQFQIHAVLFCQNCRIVWNRDRMASGNMMHISEEVWTGRGRPHIYSRNIAS